MSKALIAHERPHALRRKFIYYGVKYHPEDSLNSRSAGGELTMTKIGFLLISASMIGRRLNKPSRYDEEIA